MHRRVTANWEQLIWVGGQATLGPDSTQALSWVDAGAKLVNFLLRLFSLKARLRGAMKIEILKFCMQTALKYFRPVSFNEDCQERSEIR